MTRLILTTSDSGGGSLKVSGLADIVIPFGLELVWGPPPSDAQLAQLLSARSTQRDAVFPNWIDVIRGKHREAVASKGLGLIEFCEECDTVELWVDPVPNAQLIMVWLLSCFHGHQAASKLSLVQANVMIGNKEPQNVARWVPPAVVVTDDHFDTAGLAWRAYRAPTPQPWFDLTKNDLSALPQLRPTVLELLEELPMRATGLGATEMRLLELIAEGGASPPDVFPGHEKRNERRVFGYWEIGALLDGLARCPAPAISGLDEGPFTLEMHDDRARRQRYWQSRLSLTPLSEAILAGREDFSRHNPIYRWWGGTELTNDRLWRWDPAKGALVAP